MQKVYARRPKLQNWNESFADLVMKLSGQLFTVRRNDRLLAKSKSGGESPYRKKPQHVIQKRSVIPPANSLAGGHFTFRCSVRDGHIRNRQIGLGCELKKRRVER